MAKYFCEPLYWLLFWLFIVVYQHTLSHLTRMDFSLRDPPGIQDNMPAFTPPTERPGDPPPTRPYSLGLDSGESQMVGGGYPESPLIENEGRRSPPTRPSSPLEAAAYPRSERLGGGTGTLSQGYGTSLGHSYVPSYGGYRPDAGPRSQEPTMAPEFQEPPHLGFVGHMAREYRALPRLAAPTYGTQFRPAYGGQSRQPYERQSYLNHREPVRPAYGERHNMGPDHRRRHLPGYGGGVEGRDSPNRGEERIPVLRPGEYDGTGSWPEFQRRFESCAAANHWTVRTMGHQLCFALTGPAGNIVRKNPAARDWTYPQLCMAVDAAYGPRSHHAAMLGVELRRRVRQPGETLHALRDDIYEKVAVVYGDRPPAEQEGIGVEIFRNSLGDAELIRKLLENSPPTLSQAYEQVHEVEVTKRAAHQVSRLMKGEAPRLKTTAGVRTAKNPEIEEINLDYNEEADVETEEPQDEVEDILCRLVRDTIHTHRRGLFQKPGGPARPRASGPAPVQDGGCHRCGGKGHFARDCPTVTFNCHNCGGRGHLAKQCPTPERDTTARKPASEDTQLPGNE